MLGLACFVGGTFVTSYTTFSTIENVCAGLDRFIGQRVKIPSVETFIMNGDFLDITLVNKDERRTWQAFELLMYTYSKEYLAHAGIQQEVSREAIANAIRTGNTKLVVSVNAMFTSAAKYILGDLDLRDEAQGYVNTWFQRRMTMENRRVIHEALQLLFEVQERGGMKAR